HPCFLSEHPRPCEVGRFHRNVSRTVVGAAGGKEREMTMFTAVARASLVLVASWIWASGAAAQDWPAKPVRVIVPFGAGGAADRLGRIAADHLTKALGQ